MNKYQLTPKQIEILKLLCKFRFLNRSQIQILLHHKDTRRILSWLKDTTDKGYTNRIYSKIFGENTKPAIYYLTTKSRKILKEHGLEKPLLYTIYRERQRSRSFIDRCICIVDIYLRFLPINQEGIIHFFSKTELQKFPYLLSPVPDAYIAIEENKNQTMRYFLEVIDANTPRFVIRNRIRQYLDYASEGEWERHTAHPFPSILLVCPDEPLQRFAYRYVRKSLEEDMHAVAFFVTIKEQIQHKDKQVDIWQKVQ